MHHQRYLLFRIIFVWTGENDLKTLRVDSTIFENFWNHSRVSLRVWHMILPRHLGKCSKSFFLWTVFGLCFGFPSATRTICSFSCLGKGWWGCTHVVSNFPHCWTSKPRLRVDTRFLNVWMVVTPPFSFGHVKCDTLFCLSGVFHVKIDDKLGYYNILLFEDS